MKVCHLTSVHKQYDVRIFHKQCASLAALYEVHLLVINGTSEIKQGVHIHSLDVRLSSRVTRMWKAVNLLLSKAIELDCDVYHIHDPELLRISSTLIKKGKKVVYDVHEDVPRQILGKYWIPSVLRKIISGIFEEYENRRAAKVSYISAATPHIRERFSKINTNCIDINNYPILSPPGDDLRNEFSNNNICYVGGIDENRGITQLINSLELTEAKLHLAGSITPDAYKDYLFNLPGWKRVKYYGLVDRDGVKNIMKKSVAGLVTLKPLVNYLDALPVKMFEYMSMGLPVIASNFPLWKSIIEDHNCGICVNPLDKNEIAEAINKMLNDKEKARKMGEKGQQLVFSQYNWSVEEKKLLDMYRQFA